MNTGLPRHSTVIAWPTLTGAMSTSIGGQRLRAGVRVHLLDERPQRHRSTDGNEGAGREDEEVPAVRFFGVNCHGCLR